MRLDLTGQKFGRLTVIKMVASDARWNSRAWCICDCGKFTFVGTAYLKNGNTKSCGCRRREVATKSLLTHGMSYTPENAAYHAAKSRCNNPNNPDYGGRGIEFRLKSFQEMYDHLGDKPEPKSDYELDRIDPNGHYEIGNIRWLHRSLSMANRRPSSEWNYRKKAA